MIREIAGLRPFRPAGFRVEAEQLGDKLVIHNYGHGGCGVSLSWGTARLALELAGEAGGARSPRRVAVLGGGAVGLATGRLFQDAGWQATLYARELPPETTSDVAVALWAPSFLVSPEYRTAAFGAALAAAARFAHQQFSMLPAATYGISSLPVYQLSEGPELPLSWDWGQVPELFRSTTLPPGRHPFGSGYAHEFRMMLIEPPVFLPAMLAAFREAGGRTQRAGFRTLTEVLALPEPVIINCTGLGSRELFGDDNLLPIKGQLVVIGPQPDLSYGVISAGRGLYLVPRRDGVLLGGSQQPGVWSTAPDPAVSARILAGHQRLFARQVRAG